MVTSWWRRARQWARQPRSTPRRGKSAATTRRPFIEALEDRYAPSTLTVLNTNDSGTGSLRAAIQAANATPGTYLINFDPSVTANNDTSLSLLATGVNGNQVNQTFTVTYTDGSTQSFTQSLSDWFTPQNYAGESVALNMSYRDLSNGTADNQVFHVYAYSFALNSAKQLQSIELPNDSNVEVLAIDLTPSSGGSFDQVNLSTAFNRLGIVNDGSQFSGGLDGQGNALSANLLGSSIPFNNASFVSGPAGVNDVVSATGQTITVPVGTINLASALPDLSSNISIQGPGLSNLTVRRDQPNDTVAHEFRIFTVDAGATVTLAGLTINNGYASSSDTSVPLVGKGGAIFNQGNLTIDSCLVNFSQANFDGGAIEDDNGTLTLTNTGVDNSLAEFGGGGVRTDGSSAVLVVDNSQFDANTAGTNGGGNSNGGAINLDGGTASISNTTFSGNLANPGWGGAIYLNPGSTITSISGCTFTDNTAVGKGGAISNLATLTLITGSTFSGNSAGLDGGAIFNFNTSGAPLTVQNSTLSNNSAGFGGGGIRNQGTLVVINSTLYGNTANTSGGGLDNVGNGDPSSPPNVGNATLINVTIDANRANDDNDNTNSGGTPNAGGGVQNRLNATLTLDNSLVAGNFNGTGSTIDDVSGPVTTGSSNNLIGDGQGNGISQGLSGISNGTQGNQIGTSTAPINPLLGPLANYGGPTLTQGLLIGSPAIDTGSNSLVPAGVTTDQRGTGFSRIVAGPNAQTATVDIGAFEFQGDVQPIVQSTQQLNTPGVNLFAAIVNGGTDLIVAGPGGYSLDISGTWTSTPTTLAGGATGHILTPTGTIALNVPGLQESIPLTYSVSAPVSFTVNSSGTVVAFQFDASLSLQSLFSNSTLATATGLSTNLPSVSFGLGLGEALGFLDAPLNNAVPYLWCQLSDAIGAQMTVGGLNLSVSTGETFTVVFDPTDPFIYISGTGEKTFAFGYSLHGLIPFTPSVTPSHAANVNVSGNLLLGGSFSFTAFEVPLSFSGDLVVNDGGINSGVINALETGQSINTALANVLSNVEFGLNGSLALSFSAGPATFSIPAFQATLIYAAGQVSFAGASVDPLAGSFLETDGIIPANALGQANLDGFINFTSGQFDVHASYASGTILDGFGTNVSLDLSNSGITLNADANAGILGSIAINGDIQSNGDFDLMGNANLGLSTGLGSLNASASFDLSGTFDPSNGNESYAFSATAGFSASTTVHTIVIGPVVFALNASATLNFSINGGVVHFSVGGTVTGTATDTEFAPNKPVGLSAGISGSDQGFSFSVSVIILGKNVSIGTVNASFNQHPAFGDRAVTPAIFVGQTATLTGIITEQVPGQPFVLEVNWGDGTPTQTFVTNPGPDGTTNGTRVEIQHRYLTIPGGQPEVVDPIQLRWQNSLTGPFTTATLFTTVIEANTVVLAGAFTNAAEAHTRVVSWGDGTVSDFTYAGGVSDFSEAHVYARPGIYAISGTESDATASSTFTDLFVGNTGSSNDQVQVDPAGHSNTGTTGVTVNATLNGVHTRTTYSQFFGAIYIFLPGGNDNIHLANSLTINAVVTVGNGNDNVQLGNGNNTVTLGDGNDNIQVGNGNNVVVEGNGHDQVQAGNGNNLIVAGLGHHNVQVGNGSNILIDGNVMLTNSADSLRQVLDDWTAYGDSAANLASIRSRLDVTDNSSYANSLKAGRGLDWFWETYAKDSTNRKVTDLLN